MGSQGRAQMVEGEVTVFGSVGGDMEFEEPGNQTSEELA